MVRKLLWKLLAALIVIVPISWLFWQWNNSADPVLPALAPKAFHSQVGGTEPAYWSYALWVLLAYAVIAFLVQLVEKLLARFFPKKEKKA